VAELNKRTKGNRESGAFLLGRERNGFKSISEFMFYDDIDPHCFDRGIVEFNGRLLGLVWAACRAKGLTVVADVHVHPGGFAQSSTDKQNPIIAQAGHLALILPNFACGTCLPGQIGIYEYRGSRQWISHVNNQKFFEVR
jgi:hypothetical protein